MESCGAKSRGRSRQKSSHRDLIIRMLAEVFRVKQTKEGTIKWEQVSSSLVPVSLYSRTTQTWLNRLTADLPIEQAASTMSPDSHRLLLLLHLSSSSQKYATTQDEENRVVFQVVAHDFYGDRFWTLLNSKITQPGTKLGYGSDYFVYWKETVNNINMHPGNELQQSFASNQSPCCQYINQSGSINQNSPNWRQTWGLNFASVNDAKLFYDICSMNPINLSFNPTFLKKFSKCIGYPSCDGEKTLIRQRMPRNYTDLDLKNMVSRQTSGNGSCAITPSRTCMTRQRISSRTSSPKKQRNTSHYGHSEFVCHDQTRINSCIAQLRQSDMHRSSSNFRSRSCSTSRRKSGNKHQSLDRNMSRSTHRLSTSRGDVSNSGSINHNLVGQHQQGLISGHNPNCETLLREQELLREQYHFHNYMCPKKPARGQFRESLSIHGLQKRSTGVSPVSPEVNQRSESQNCGYISDQTGKKSTSHQASVTDNNKLVCDDIEQLDQRASVKFLESKSNQRRSTAVDTSSINRFNASLARAQYAKSKNLSLDAGGFQSTPTPTNPANWNDSIPLKQQINANEEVNGSNQEEEQQNDGKEELVPINLMNSEVTCIKLHQNSLNDPTNAPQVEDMQKIAKGGRQESSGSIDYQLQMEALKVAVPYGFDTNRCEASTTTDDLPLDPIVRKRMFQLTVAKAEKEIDDKYREEQESFLESERLLRTMKELTSFQANRTGARYAPPKVRCSDNKESYINQPPEPPMTIQLSDLPHPSFAAHQGYLSDSSLVSSPEAEAVAFSMRTKRKVSRASSGNQGLSSSSVAMRSQTMPNIQQHQNQDHQDDYACCLDMIGVKHESHNQIESQTTNQFRQVPTIDQPSQIYHHQEDEYDDDDDDDHDYNYDPAVAIDGDAEGNGSHQLCYMQKLSNTLSSVSDFEH